MRLLDCGGLTLRRDTCSSITASARDERRFAFSTPSDDARSADLFELPVQSADLVAKPGGIFESELRSRLAHLGVERRDEALEFGGGELASVFGNITGGALRGAAPGAARPLRA